MTDATVVAGYDFSAYPTIVDVGGGHGPLLAAILAAAPASRGVLYDLPSVVANAPSLLRKQDVADRVRIAEGSFFDSVPPDGDAYVLKNIIHDWPDEKAMQILRNVRAAAGPRATVLLVEFVIPRHDRDFPGKWVDLEMMLNLGARERTAAEYRDLLSPSRIPDDTGGANRFTPQRGGGQRRVITTSGTQEGSSSIRYATGVVVDSVTFSPSRRPMRSCSRKFSFCPDDAAEGSFGWQVGASGTSPPRVHLP